MSPFSSPARPRASASTNAGCCGTARPATPGERRGTATLARAGHAACRMPIWTGPVHTPPPGSLRRGGPDEQGRSLADTAPKSMLE